MERLNQVEGYHHVMQEQTDNRNLRKITGERDIIHYIPHQEGIKSHVESIKIWVVLEGLAKSDNQTPSLN